MDIAQTLSGLDRRAGELLKETLDAQEDPAALLGEDGQIPEKLRQELRTQALRDALAEPKTVTAQITFQLIEQDGQWWALPDQATRSTYFSDKKVFETYANYQANIGDDHRLGFMA